MRSNLTSLVKLDSPFVGELYADLNTGKLFTKNYKGNFLRINAAKTKLTDFDIYIYGDATLSFLRLYLDATTRTYKIIDRISRLFLSDLDGYSQTTPLDNTKALGFEDGTLQPYDVPSFTLDGLADAYLDASPATDNYVVTSSYVSNYDSGAYFEDKVNRYRKWNLLPEASAFKAFDNVSAPVSSTYKVARIPRPNLYLSSLIYGHNLYISDDTSPSLGGTLDADAYSIRNTLHDCATYTPTTEVASVNPNIHTHSAVNIEASLCKVLKINPVITYTGLFYVSVFIENFGGEVYVYKSRFVDGVPLVLEEGHTHLINLHIFRTIERTEITVFNKAHVKY